MKRSFSFATGRYFAFLIYFAICSAFLSPQAGDAQISSDWLGIFQYDYYGGRTRGGSAIAVSYRLSLDDNAAARLEVTGYQSDQSYICDVSEEGTRLDIRFHSYKNGDLVNQYGVSQYKPGEVLFAIVAEHKNGRAQFITFWQGMIPDPALPRKGVYFIKRQ
nr:DUF5991 domain-containing protein [uncultured Rhodopila sp.]